MQAAAGGGGGGEGDGAAGALDWEDRLSWEDSERFEEDSICSWMSEESICQNWRGWSARAAPGPHNNACSYSGGISARSQPSCAFRSESGVPALKSLAARTVARSKSFEEMEQFFRGSHLSIPIFAVDIQELVFKHCFPENEEDIRLYSCLANGNAEEFQRGDALYRARAVKDLLQIGYHLSANVDTSGIVRSGGPNATAPLGEVYSVSLTADRCRITSCVCSCNPERPWCSHVVAVCLHRMMDVDSVQFRAPVSESLNQLNLDQLRKFAQYLIQELPRQILPTAQRLIDQLKDANSEENKRNGAPDPTAGGPQDDPASWCLDDQILRDSIRKILTKFCVPSPTVFSDVNYLSSTVPPVTNEWMVLLRPLRGREPEGLWNLLNIVREMYRRNDDNAKELLHIITCECLSYNQVMLWWYQTKLSQSGGKSAGSGLSSKSSTGSNQYGCASLCDEIVYLWRLAALNPLLNAAEREELRKTLVDYHVRAVEKVWSIVKANNTPAQPSNVAGRIPLERIKFDLDSFPGFKPAVKACLADWSQCKIPGLPHKPPAHYAELSVSCPAADVRDLVSPRTQSSCSPTLPVIRELNQSRRPKGPSELTEARASLDGLDEEAEVRAENQNVFIPEDEVRRLYLAPPEAERKAPEQERDPIKEVEQALRSLEMDSEASDVEFSKCESLYAHGYAAQVRSFAVSLAEELLRSPPNLMLDLPPPLRIPTSHTPSKVGKKGKKRPSEEFIPHPEAVENSLLATGTLHKVLFLFEVLLKGPELHRLAFSIGIFALELPRQPAATKFLEVKMSHQEAGIVAALKRIPLGADEIAAIRLRAEQFRSGAIQMRSPVLPFSLAHYVFDCLCNLPNRHLSPTDDTLGFEAAVSALGMKTGVSEAEHPLLCEGIRRQRGDLAIALFSKYKDNLERVAMIMDRLLDPDMHMMYRGVRSNAAHYLNNGNIDAQRLISLSGSRQSLTDSDDQHSSASIRPSAVMRSCSAVSAGFDELVANIDAETGQLDDDTESEALGDRAIGRRNSESGNESRDPSPKQSTSSESSIAARELADVVATDAFAQAASAETSPPLAFCVGDKGMLDYSSKGAYGRGRRNMAPALPNQASEAHAHSMTELAKRLLNEAGATQSTAIFLPQNAGHANQPHGPHRILHLCAFQIGLYALGLHNKVTPNWLSRTYSSHVSWISGQAMEIGRTAIKILIDTWENHLTPTEVANLADKASQGRDGGVVSAAAELSLSVLPFAHALNPGEIRKALTQCREQNRYMLQKACDRVEEAARAASGGVYPEVLFTVAQHWYDMHKERSSEEVAAAQQHQNAAAQAQAARPIPEVDAARAHHPVFPPTPNNFGAPVYHMGHLGVPYQYIPPNIFQQHPGNHQQQLQLQQQQLINFLMAANSGQRFPPFHFLPPNGQPPVLGNQHHGNFPLPYFQQQNTRPVHVSQSAPNLVQQQRHHHHQIEAPRTQSRYLESAYRVGIFALQTLGRRILDERSYQKYTQSPPYGDNVNWLFKVSKELSLKHVEKFCTTCAESVVSPFLLWSMAEHATKILPMVPVSGMIEYYRPANCIGSLVDKCVKMLHTAAAQKLSHPKFVSSDLEEIKLLIRTANVVFSTAFPAEYPHRFGQFITHLKKQKACKNKDTWNHILEVSKEEPRRLETHQGGSLRI